MALRKCAECDGEVSEFAEACPHCGAPKSIAFSQNKEQSENLNNNKKGGESNTKSGIIESSKKMIPCDNCGKPVTGKIETCVHCGEAIRLNSPSVPKTSSSEGKNVQPNDVAKDNNQKLEPGDSQEQTFKPKTTISMIKCQSCGKKVTGKIETCVHCGQAIRQNSPSVPKTSSSESKNVQPNDVAEDNNQKLEPGDSQEQTFNLKTTISMIKCQSCGKKVTGKIETCVHCGQAIRLNSPSVPKTSSSESKNVQPNDVAKDNNQKLEPGDSQEQTFKPKTTISMIKCQSCGKKVTGKIETCVHCGQAIRLNSLSVPKTSSSESKSTQANDVAKDNNQKLASGNSQEQTFEPKAINGMIKCQSCGKKVTGKLELCVHCGAPCGKNESENEDIGFHQDGRKGNKTFKEGAHNFRCGHCGASHAKDFIFCGACGLKGTSESARKESSHKKCLECGSSNSNASKYCFNCGLSLEGEPFKQVDRKPWWGRFREASSGWKLSFKPWWKNFSYTKFAIGSSSFVMGIMIHFVKNTVAIVFLYIPLTIAFLFGMTWLTGNWGIFSDDWGRSSGQFDVLEVRSTGSPSRDQYDVTLRNFSSRRITVFTYLQTSDGYQFCPTEHILRPNSTTIDTVRCRMFGSINNERYEIYATSNLSNLPSELARQLRSGRNIGRIEGFR